MASSFDALVSPAVFGQPYSGVFTYVEQVDGSLVKAFDHGMQSQVLLDGLTWTSQTMTVYNARLSDEDLMILSCGPDSMAFPSKTNSHFTSGLVELCAGMGSMGIGPCFVGGQVLASVDCSPLACEHLRRNNHGIVIQGDLLDLQTTINLHQVIVPLCCWAFHANRIAVRVLVLDRWTPDLRFFGQPFVLSFWFGHRHLWLSVFRRLLRTLLYFRLFTSSQL